jgi:hypothetical protein
MSESRATPDPENAALPRGSRATAAALAAVCAGAVVLWSIGLGYGLPTKSRWRSVNVDELTWLQGLSRMRPANLDFNPKSHHQPHLYFYTLGAALRAADTLGLVDVRPDKEHYRKHSASWARLYLVGRWLQVAFGVACLVLIYFLGRAIDGAWTGVLAALLFALTPGMVGAAHFNQANVPVTFFVLAALLGSLRVARGGGIAWGLAAGSLAGIAISTKYSALPLLPVLGLAHALRRRSVLGALGASAWATYGAALLAFLLGTPYAVLAAGAYWKQFFGPFLTNATVRAGDPLWFRPFLPIVWVLPATTGVALLAAGVAGLVFLCRRARDPGPWLLGAWSGLFYVFLIRLGRLASHGRCLVLVPALCLGCAALVVRCRTRRWALPLAVAAAVNAAALSGVLVEHYARNDLVQERASAWLRRHLAPGTAIAIPRPHWYTPDILLQSIDRPEGPPHGFRVTVLRYDTARLAAERAAYVLTSHDEEANVPNTYPGAPSFVACLRSGKDYRLLKTFPFTLQLGPLPVFVDRPWNRPDIVWTQALRLDVRAEHYAAEQRRLAAAGALP